MIADYLVRVEFHLLFMTQNCPPFDFFQTIKNILSKDFLLPP